MTFIEPHPDLILPNPGGPEDPLGESVLDPANPWLRIFEPVSIRLIIGRGQDPWRELVVDHVRADAVPVHRRVCGGGAVVLAPGMVVVAIRLRREGFPDAWLTRIASTLRAGLGTLGVGSEVRGHGDLVVTDGGVDRKILGSSLRQTASATIYLGALLVEDATGHFDRLLAHPSREPDYRAGRTHAAFCGHLGRYGIGARDLVRALTIACEAELSLDALR